MVRSRAESGPGPQDWAGCERVAGAERPGRGGGGTDVWAAAQGHKGRPGGVLRRRTQAPPAPEGRLGPLPARAGRRGRGNRAGRAPIRPCGPPSVFRASGPRARRRAAGRAAMCGP